MRIAPRSRKIPTQSLYNDCLKEFSPFVVFTKNSLYQFGNARRVGVFRLGHAPSLNMTGEMGLVS